VLSRFVQKSALNHGAQDELTHHIMYLGSTRSALLSGKTPCRLGSLLLRSRPQAACRLKPARLHAAVRCFLFCSTGASSKKPTAILVKP